MTNRMWVPPHPFLTMQISLHFILTNRMWVRVHFLLPWSLIAFHPMTNREWVTPYFFFFTMESHGMTNSWWVILNVFLYNALVSSHDQQGVSDTAFMLCHAVSLHVIPWPTASEWHSMLHFTKQSHGISSHDHWTACEWHYFSFDTMQISSHDQ
jgi:hypothetical protein